MDGYTIGSDQFPTLLRFGQLLKVEDDRPWDFSRAKCEEFKNKCKDDLENVRGGGRVDDWNDNLECFLLLKI